MTSNRHRPLPPHRTPRVPPRPTGRRGSRLTGPPWGVIALVGGGVIVLLAAGFLTIRVLTAPSDPTPTAVSNAVRPTASSATATATPPPPPPTAILTPLPTPTLVPPTPFPLDIPALQQFMLDLINDDRRANGLTELAWDREAATAGLRHAQDMAQTGYLSHWNPEGYGPDYRYTLAGGLHAVRENIYLYEHSPSEGPHSATAWEALIRQAQANLLASPGRRENLLAPVNTHVGIGLAYEPTAGRIAIAQEFIGWYVTLQPILPQVTVGQVISVTGRLENRATNPVLNVTYEPLPRPRSLTELNVARSYVSPAQIYETVPLTIDDQGRFEQAVTLDYQGQGGLYHLRIGVDTSSGSILAADVVIKVQ